ncbi:helix-turn-helix domain-containing protein [Actinomadura litoris]|uniref:helix-turn-helix domain-containing protein n=1 Tax=Actinomadura litoris TaxID=2678616 RepID=UPI001FA759F9|nr:helix-turn-helix transcriptional regulator [Actinomadura litoris]
MTAPEHQPGPEIELTADTTARELFIYHLKRLREERKVSQNTVANAIYVSASLVGAIEVGTRTPSPAVARGLDKFFELGCFFTWLQPRVVEEVGLPADFPVFIEVEGEATIISVYENTVVMGLLQVEDYARAVLERATPPDKLDDVVATRLQRQEILDGENPPQVVFVVDEYALHRRYGDRETRIAQYEHLLKLMQRPNIAIYVVPDRGEVAPEVAFQLLKNSDGTVTGYYEGPRGRGRMLDEPRYVNELQALFERIRASALSAADSELYLRGLLETLKEENEEH